MDFWSVYCILLRILISGDWAQQFFQFLPHMSINVHNNSTKFLSSHIWRLKIKIRGQAYSIQILMDFWSVYCILLRILISGDWAQQFFQFLPHLSINVQGIPKIAVKISNFRIRVPETDEWGKNWKNGIIQFFCIRILTKSMQTDWKSIKIWML